MRAEFFTRAKVIWKIFRISGDMTVGQQIGRQA